MRAIFAVFLLIGLCSSANAQLGYQVKTTNIADTVFKSMQCELGLFAVKAKGFGLDPGLKAHVKWSTTGTNDLNPSASVGFGGLLSKIIQTPNIKGGYDLTKYEGGTIEGKLNINQGNTAVCVGKQHPAPAVELGIYDCLVMNQSVIKGGLTASCVKKVTAKATFDASGKFSFWVITFGPDLAWSNTVTFEMDIDAPAANTPTGAPGGNKTAQN